MIFSPLFHSWERRIHAARKLIENLSRGQSGSNDERGEATDRSNRILLRLKDHRIAYACDRNQPAREIGERRTLARHLHHVRIAAG